MKIFFILLTSFLLTNVLFGQDRTKDAYYFEESGYFINAQPALNGIVFTDNYCNSLYYFSDGELEKIANSAGCGRYFNVSADGKFVAYKQILNGKQNPVIIDLESGRSQVLVDNTALCGQPVVFDSGLVYTLDKSLVVLESNITTEFYIGDYVNYIAVSPDGKQVAYALDDIIFLYDLNSGQKTQISQSNKMSTYPKFSPDGQKILFQSGNIFVYDILEQKSYDCGAGLAPTWSPNSETIAFHQTISDDFTLLNSDIFTCNFHSPLHVQITNTIGVSEMNPCFISDSEILFDTYSTREICAINLNSQETRLIYKHVGEMEISYFEPEMPRLEVLISGQVPYVHQVYDTPNAHYGNGSCAPTTAIMAVAYYNKLPKWPTLVTKLYPHISDYGSYVSTRYRFNEHYFDENHTTSGGDVAYGGYGYMWGLGSPNSQMRNYMQLHYFESTQKWNDNVFYADVIAEINADFPLPMCVMLSSAGHLILAKGYIANQHTLIFSDPYGDKNTPSWPSYDGHKAYYDWPGYNNGFANLDYNGSYGVIAWTVTAHAEEVSYNDTIIDDVFYHHGFEVNNSVNGSQMRYFRDQNAGYNGHSWWTITEASSNDIVWVRWIPTLTQEGYYNISAFIPSTNANSQNAPYRIKQGNLTTKVLINQAEFNDEWADLGDFYYEPDEDFWVYLGDSTGIGSQSIVFDAVKFDFIPKPIVDFQTESLVVCKDIPVLFTNNSQNAETYNWTFYGENIITSDSENPEIVFNVAGNYSVKLIAYGLYQSDSAVFESFITVNNPPIASFTASSYDVYLPDAFVYFTNTSNNAQHFEWDFGNGQYSDDNNPYIVYTDEGTFSISLTAFGEGCPQSVYEDSNVVVVHGPLDIEIESADKLYVFPNPVNDYLFITSESEILSLRITDITGRTVAQFGKGANKFNLTNLSGGLYTYYAETIAGIISGKIVVKR